MRSAWLAALACALAVLPRVQAAPAAPDPQAAELGRRIYMQGLLPDGTPLEGSQAGVGVTLRGPDGACVNCHQRSGLGTHEGSEWLPPVTGAYLFRARVPRGHERELASAGGPHGARGPYTEETLARAIRSGVDADGHPLSDLMPRYAVDDAALVSLIDYLKRLSAKRPPGLEGGIVHLATVVTPDSEPVKRRAALEVLEQFVAERNTAPVKPGLVFGTVGAAPRDLSGALANRHWRLQTWSLTGAPAGWGAQLDRRFAAEPVFALLSGVGAAEWAPVHQFCERHGVPCFFPNVDVPVVADSDFYSVYFSQGVLLEAQLIAGAIKPSGDDGKTIAVHQIYRRGDSGAAAARALAAALAGSSASVREDALPARATGAAVRRAVEQVRGSPILVLWLRPADVAALAGSMPPASHVWLSGLMAEGEGAPLPANWRRVTRMTYPFELPQRRGVQLDYAAGWFRFRHIPLVSPRVQADTFLACTLMTDAFKLMGEDISAPYLVEQLHALLEHRTLTGYYPRLALARDQHFASKGAYIVHFAAPQGAALDAESPWSVPP